MRLDKIPCSEVKLVSNLSCKFFKNIIFPKINQKQKNITEDIFLRILFFYNKSVAMTKAKRTQILCVANLYYL